MSGRRVPRNWGPGRHFGRRLARIPSLPQSPAPLFALGTSERIERVRLLYVRDAFLHDAQMIRDLRLFAFNSGWPSQVTRDQEASSESADPDPLGH
jgi:hypothetical protein